MHVPEYVAARIRRATPPGCCVVHGSTPVVSFGDATISTTATLGLNPSRIEFLDRNGRELVGDSRRLATHSSLGTDDLVRANADVVAQVVDECNRYFERQPYRFWFDRLEPILKACGTSYYNGTACHLDLVQWATDPTWSGLGRETQKHLLAQDASFLAEQLRNERLRLLLVNGRGVLETLRRAFRLRLDEQPRIAGCALVDTRIYTGSMFDRVRIVAWSTNLQSGWGVTNKLKAELATRVADLAAA